jgi:hypothetical protein
LTIRTTRLKIQRLPIAPSEGAGITIDSTIFSGAVTH